MTPKQAAKSLDLAGLQTTLDAAYPERHWLQALEIVQHTGVADTQQIQAVTGFTQNQINRFLERIAKLAGNGILVRVPFNLPRPGQRGRAPIVYKLGPAGAALLRANGYPQTHLCKLEEISAIAHAQATLDARLVALRANLAVQTERELPYDEDKALRPDNLITLPNGCQAIFEIEQAADLTLLRRIVDSLQHKAAFFTSQARHTTSPTVRVLFYLARGRAWDKTIAVWERATDIVAQKEGGALPFKIVARPLQEFLDQPDWNEPPDFQRWESLFDPSKTGNFAPVALAPALPVQPSPQQSKQAHRQNTQLAQQLPQSLTRRTAADDRAIILAYLQHIQEQGLALATTADTPLPSPDFFEMVQVIYLPSHPLDATPWQQATHPYVSLYLLRKYMDMHPRLREALSKALVRGSSSMRWNNTTILHRMQVVISLFLRYHGLRVGKSLQACPAVAAWDAGGPRDFGVQVHLHPELLVESGVGIVPRRDETQYAEEALAWVLWALFAYSEDLSLKRAVFW